MKNYSKMLTRRSIRRILSGDIQPITERNMVSLIELIEEYLKSMPRLYRLGVNTILLGHVLIPPIELRFPKLYSGIPLISVVTKLVLAIALLRLFDEKDARLYSNDFD